MSGTDIRTMKDVLCSQQQLLQKLYAELDVQREASGSAVCEAMSIILRLQEEKSALKLEATQYKRMTEEKINHAQESLENFQELMHQKEMEIAALEFQVQAYKCRLISMGVSEVGGVNENRFPEDMLIPKALEFVGEREKGSSGHVRRLRSLPPLRMKESIHNRGSVGRKKSGTPEVSHDSDVVVRQCTDAIPPKLEQGQGSKMPKEEEAFADSGSSSNVYDVFEVPQVDESSKVSSEEEGMKNELVWDEGIRLGRSDVFIEETWKSSHGNDESECVKKLLSNQEKALLASRGGISIDCNLAFVHPQGKVPEYQPEVQPFSQRDERVESVRNTSRHEIAAEEGEELPSLGEIRENLNAIQSEMSGWRRKQYPWGNPSLLSIQEEMLHFWL